MMNKMILLVEIILFNLPFHASSSDLIVTSDFTRQSRFDDVYLPTSHLLSEYKTVSLIKCVINCKRYPNCRSVRYHVVREECHLLNACLMCNFGMDDIGWRYFCENRAPVVIPAPSNGHIAFQASTNDVIPARGDVLIFDKILTNIGNAYNSTSGIFRAPREGRYIFSWSQQSRRINTYTNSRLFVQGQVTGKLHDKGGNVVSNFVMVDLQIWDQVYVCSYYKNIYVDTLSQFSGWIYDKPTDSCDISFHGTAVGRRSETLVYKSATPPNESYSKLTSGSNGTVVMMSLTTVNRGGFSNLRYVIDGVDVMASVIDGWRLRDVSVTLIAVQHINENSSIEVRNQKTHINSVGNTFTAVCISKVPAVHIWASDPEQATNRTVIFTKVLLNEGHMFDESNGTIHAQRKGLYFLTWTVHSFNDTTVLSSLIVNGAAIRHLETRSLPDHHTVSACIAVHQLEENDEVEIRIVEGETGDLGVYFSGFMIASLDQK